jgi:hypothetical protein
MGLSLDPQISKPCDSSFGEFFYSNSKAFKLGFKYLNVHHTISYTSLRTRDCIGTKFFNKLTS